MSDFSRTYFKVMDVLCLILGILCCCTIIGAVVGVPLIIGHNKFKEASETTDPRALVAMKGSLFGWGVFFAIVMSASIVGLVVVIICVVRVNQELEDLGRQINGAQVYNQYQNNNQTFEQKAESGVKSFIDETKQAFGIKSKVEKQKEKLEELNELKSQGIITEEEYQAMRKKVLDI